MDFFFFFLVVNILPMFFWKIQEIFNKNKCEYIGVRRKKCAHQFRPIWRNEGHCHYHRNRGTSDIRISLDFFISNRSFPLETPTQASFLNVFTRDTDVIYKMKLCVTHGFLRVCWYFILKFMLGKYSHENNKHFKIAHE